MIANILAKAAQIARIPPDGTAATTWIKAAGTTSINTGSIRTRGSRRICWIVLVGVITATGTLDVKAQQSSDDGSVDGYSDLAGSAATQVVDTDGGKMVIIDYEVEKDYQRLVLARATANVVIDGVIAILYDNDCPAAQHSTVKSLEYFNRLTEGTA